MEKEINTERLVNAIKRTADIIMEEARRLQPPPKPKKAELIRADIQALELTCYEMQRKTLYRESNDAYGFVISELHNIIHKKY